MSLRHRLLLFAFALATLLAVAPRAHAAGGVVAVGSSAGTMPDLTVWDEANTQTSLYERLRAAGSGPVLVLPVYTRCTMSCPVLAQGLVKQTAQLTGTGPYRVLIFSFDAGEDSASLTKFRQTEGLPANWILVRSDAGDIRRFCDFFHYSVLTEGPVMIHLNQMFLLDHAFEWRATFIDQRWDAAALGRWLRLAESHGLLGWIAMNPQMLVYAGFAGLLLALAIILGVMLLRSRGLLNAPPADADSL